MSSFNIPKVTVPSRADFGKEDLDKAGRPGDTRVEGHVPLFGGKPLEVSLPEMVSAVTVAKTNPQQDSAAPSYCSLIGDFKKGDVDELCHVLAKVSSLRTKDSTQRKILSLLQEDNVWMDISQFSSKDVQILYGVLSVEETAAKLAEDTLFDRLLPGLRDILERCVQGSFSCTEKTLLRARIKKNDDSTTASQSKKHQKKKTKKQKGKKPSPVTMKMGSGDQGQETVDDWFLDKIHLPEFSLDPEVLHHSFKDPAFALSILSGCHYTICGCIGKTLSSAEIAADKCGHPGQTNLLLNCLCDIGLASREESTDGCKISTTIDDVWAKLLGLPLGQVSYNPAVSMHLRRLSISASNLTSKSEFKLQLTADPLRSDLAETDPVVATLTPNDSARGAKPFETSDVLTVQASQFTTSIANALIDPRKDKTGAELLIDQALQKGDDSLQFERWIPATASESHNKVLSKRKDVFSFFSELEFGKEEKDKRKYFVAVPLKAAKGVAKEKEVDITMPDHVGLYLTGAKEDVITRGVFLPKYGNWAMIPTERARITPLALDRSADYNVPNKECYFNVRLLDPVLVEGKPRFYNFNLYIPVPHHNVTPFPFKETQSAMSEKDKPITPNFQKLFTYHPALSMNRGEGVRGENRYIWPLRRIDTETESGGKVVTKTNFSLDINVEVGRRGTNTNALSMIAQTDIIPLFGRDTSSTNSNMFFIEMGTIYICINADDLLYVPNYGPFSMYANVLMKASDFFKNQKFPYWLPVTSTVQQRSKSFNISAGSIGDKFSWTLNSLGEYTFFYSKMVAQVTTGTSMSVHPTCCKTSPIVASILNTKQSKEDFLMHSSDVIGRIWPEYHPKSLFSATKRNKQSLPLPPEHEQISELLRDHYLVYASSTEWELYGDTIVTDSPPFVPVRSTILPNWKVEWKGELSDNKPITVKYTFNIKVPREEGEVSTELSCEVTGSTTWDCAHEGIQALIECLPLNWFNLVSANGVVVPCVHKDAEHVNATALSPPRDGRFWYIFPEDLQPDSDEFAAEFGHDLQDLFLRRRDFLKGADATTTYVEGKPKIVILSEGKKVVKSAWELGIEIKTSSAEKLAFYRYCHRPLYQQEGLGALVVGSINSIVSKGMEHVWAFPFLGAAGNALVGIRQRDLSSKMRARVTFGGNQCLRRGGDDYDPWYSKRDNGLSDEGKAMKTYLAFEYLAREYETINEIFKDLISMVDARKLRWTSGILEYNYNGNWVTIGDLGSKLAEKFTIWIGNYNRAKTFYERFEAMPKPGEDGFMEHLSSIESDKLWFNWYDMYVPPAYVKSLLRPSYTSAPGAKKIKLTGNLEKDLEELLQTVRPQMEEGLVIDDFSFDPKKDDFEQPSAAVDEGLEDSESEMSDDEFGEDYDKGVELEESEDEGEPEGGNDGAESQDSEPKETPKEQVGGEDDDTEGTDACDHLPKGPTYDKNSKSLVMSARRDVALLGQPSKDGMPTPVQISKVLQKSIAFNSVLTTKLKRIGRIRINEKVSMLPRVDIDPTSSAAFRLASGTQVLGRPLIQDVHLRERVKPVIWADIYGLLAHAKFVRLTFKLPWKPAHLEVTKSDQSWGWTGKTSNMGVGKIRDLHCWTTGKLSTREENFAIIPYNLAWWVVPLQYAARRMNYNSMMDLAHVVADLFFKDTKDQSYNGIDFSLSFLITQKVVDIEVLRTVVSLLRLKVRSMLFHGLKNCDLSAYADQSAGGLRAQLKESGKGKADALVEDIKELVEFGNSISTSAAEQESFFGFVGEKSLHSSYMKACLWVYKVSSMKIRANREDMKGVISARVVETRKDCSIKEGIANFNFGTGVSGWARANSFLESVSFEGKLGDTNSVTFKRSLLMVEF